MRIKRARDRGYMAARERFEGSRAFLNRSGAFELTGRIGGGQTSAKSSVPQARRFALGRERCPHSRSAEMRFWCSADRPSQRAS
jgi:hypothetical protein